MSAGKKDLPCQSKISFIRSHVFARMAKLADASDSKSDTARCVGSTPTPGTIQRIPLQLSTEAGFFVFSREKRRFFSLPGNIQFFFFRRAYSPIYNLTFL